MDSVKQSPVKHPVSPDSGWSTSPDLPRQVVEQVEPQREVVWWNGDVRTMHDPPPAAGAALWRPANRQDLEDTHQALSEQVGQLGPSKPTADRGQADAAKLSGANGGTTADAAPDSAPEHGALGGKITRDLFANDDDDGDAHAAGYHQTVTAPQAAVASDAGDSAAHAPTSAEKPAGGDDIAYAVSDGGGTVDRVVIHANKAPTAVADKFDVKEDTALTRNAAQGVLANDGDGDGHALTVSAYQATSAQGGTVAMNADGSFTYTPAGN
ncbi:MAG: Ig-like domain-containing protein, partial [Rhodospirillales bacterium]